VVSRVFLVAQHAGVVGLVSLPAEGLSSCNSQYKFNKPQRQYINQLVEAAVKKTKHDSKVVELDEDDEWSKGMTPQEHMHVLSAAQSNQGTDLTELEIEEDNLEDFKKRYRATRKRIKKSLFGKK
jgi:hypothetical protein